MQKLKIYIIILLVLLYILPINNVAYSSTNFWPHFTYLFFHANIFHLAGNCIALYFVLNNKTLKVVTLLPTLYTIAVIASFIDPSPGTTLGFSGVLFTMVGINMIRHLQKMSKIGLTSTLILGFIMPNVNGMLHLICLVLGYVAIKTFFLIQISYNDCRRFN